MNLYCIDFPNGKKYVGIESHTGKRKAYHSKGYKHTLVGRAINKHGWQNCTFRYLLTNAKKETCLHMEIKLIRLWNLQNRTVGYNISSGGECSSLGSKRSKESIKKQFETRRKNNFVVTEEHKNKISKTLTGRKHTHKRKVNQSRTRSFNVYKITKSSGHCKNRKSYKILETEFIGTWRLRSDAAKELNLHVSKIGMCLNKKRFQHKNYIFNYNI